MIRFLRGCCELMFLSVFLCAHSTCSSQEPIAGASPSSRTKKESPDHGDILQFINVPTIALPDHVQLVQEIRTAPLIPVTGNPDVRFDPQWIRPIAVFFGIRDKPDLETVRASVVALYQENDPANEIGVYGIYFSDKKAADRRFEKLAKDKKDSPFILKGRLLLCIWKDDGVSNSAFEAVRDYFRMATFQPAHRTDLNGKGQMLTK